VAIDADMGGPVFGVDAKDDPLLLGIFAFDNFADLKSMSTIVKGMDNGIAIRLLCSEEVLFWTEPLKGFFSHRGPHGVLPWLAEVFTTLVEALSPLLQHAFVLVLPVS
jgi:hypothetical protein